ncbi:unnamed protein product [Trichobilharzia regenti]|nr:unnamed protein product [Trichobilharzia regenti]
MVRAAAVQQLVPLAKLFGPDLKSELGLLIARYVCIYYSISGHIVFFYIFDYHE